MKEIYYAVLEEEKEGGYSASFPSIPGCFTQGDSMRETIENCQEVASLHISVLVERKKEIPLEKSIQSLKKEIEKNAILVPILVDIPSQTKQISVTLPEDRLSRIDAFVKKNHTNRSAFLLRGAEMLMQM